MSDEQDDRLPTKVTRDTAGPGLKVLRTKPLRERRKIDFLPDVRNKLAQRQRILPDGSRVISPYVSAGAQAEQAKAEANPAPAEVPAQPQAPAAEPLPHAKGDKLDLVLSALNSLTARLIELESKPASAPPEPVPPEPAPRSPRPESEPLMREAQARVIPTPAADDREVRKQLSLQEVVQHAQAAGELAVDDSFVVAFDFGDDVPRTFDFDFVDILRTPGTAEGTAIWVLLGLKVERRWVGDLPIPAGQQISLMTVGTNCENPVYCHNAVRFVQEGSRKGNQYGDRVFIFAADSATLQAAE